jgi:hypothetical protein
MASKIIDSSSLYEEETIADMGSTYSNSKLALNSEEQIAKLDEESSALRRVQR